MMGAKPGVQTTEPAPQGMDGMDSVFGPHKWEGDRKTRH